MLISSLHDPVLGISHSYWQHLLCLFFSPACCVAVASGLLFFALRVPVPALALSSFYLCRSEVVELSLR